MKNIKTIIGLLCLSIVSLMSCNGGSSNNEVVRGDGNVIKHEVPVGVYNKIRVEGAVDLVYQAKPDDAAYLMIEADDNIIPLVDVEVKSKTLKIKIRESINPSRFTIYTNSPTLEFVESKGASNIHLKEVISGDNLKIEMRGVGSLTGDNLNYDKAEFKLFGSGNMTLGGHVNKAKYEISGTGDISALEMSVNELECLLKGVGNMDVNAVDKMSIEIKGTGNISYTGNPQITKQNIKGTGIVKVL